MQRRVYTLEQKNKEKTNGKMNRILGDRKVYVAQEQDNSILVNGPCLKVSPVLARKIGANCALFLQLVHFWLCVNAEKNDQASLPKRPMVGQQYV